MKIDAIKAVAFSLSFPYIFFSFPLQPNIKIKLPYLFVYLFIYWSLCHFTLIHPTGFINKNLRMGSFLFCGFMLQYGSEFESLYS